MIELRKAEGDDIGFYYSLKCEKSAIIWGGFDQPPDKNEILVAWNNLVCDKKKRLYILWDEDTPVGYAQTVNENMETEISMGVAEKYRGRGYGREIIRLVILKESQYNNATFSCYIREDNYASRCCFLQNGFKETDMYTQYYFKADNKWHKMIKYILEND